MAAFPFFSHNSDQPKSFLKAEWRNLAFANYSIDPKVLQPYLPAGTELDFWNGNCYLSLVAFLFRETRVFGIRVPGHVHFEEVNIRFYVKRFENGKWKRGVVFIKEIVPKYAIAFVANTFYKEKYERLPMAHQISVLENHTKFDYRWKKNGHWNNFEVTAENTLTDIEQASETEFITEHYFGYSRQNAQTTFEYEVKHPKWQQRKVTEFSIQVDFETVYGKSFGFLSEQEPVSVFLADGSAISVENKIRIDN